MLATREVDDQTDVSAFSDDQRLIWEAQKEMYAGFLAADRERIDRHIHPDATIWDGVTETIARGIADLNAIRAARPAGDAKPVVTHLLVEDPIIDAGSDVAVSRHLLRVESIGPDGVTRQLMRVSQGWRRVDGAWQIIHAHEDLFSVETTE